MGKDGDDSYARDLAEASAYLERGRTLAEGLPNGDYGRLVRQAIASQLTLLAEDGGAAPPSRAT